MSVINSVLKNLEHQSSSFTPLDIGELSVKNKSHQFSKLWLISLLVLVCGGIIALYFMSNFINQATPVVEEIEPTKTVDPVKTAIPTKPLNSIQAVDSPVAIQQKPAVMSPEQEITGLHINESREDMELEFQLSGETKIFLKQRANNLYVFQFDNTKSAILMPEINDNDWLSRISFKQAGNSLNLRFDTRDGVLVQTHDSQLNKKNLWSIRFKLPAALTPKNLTAMRPMSTDGELSKAVTKMSSEAEQKGILEQGGGEKDSLQKHIKLDIKPIKEKLSDDQEFKNALGLLNNGQWIQAEALLLQLLGGEKDRMARLKLLDVYQSRQNVSAVNNLLSGSLRQYPQDLDFMKLQANQWFSNEQYHNIINQYKNNATDIHLISLVAASHQRLGQHAEAIDAFMTGINLDPLQSKLWVSLAISQQHLNLQEQALNSYKMALKSGQLNVRLNAFVNQRISQLSR